MTEPTENAVLERQLNEIFGGAQRERLHRIWSRCWIDYPIALKALKQLEWLLNHPRVDRPPCCLLVGETNNGKTSIARKFQRTHMPLPTESGDAKRMPIVYLQSPPTADSAGLYIKILKAVGAPFTPTGKLARLEDQATKLLANLGTRILIIDELHSFLQGTRDRQGLFLNALRNLTNELKIPIVGIGTRSVLRIMQTDQEFGNRFDPLELPRWELGREYALFLANICRRTGMKDVGFIKDKALVRRVHTMSAGLTGETWKVMCTALEKMDEIGRLTLDAELLDSIDWTAPGERRWQAS